jgi:sulfate adenylyltransferase
MNSARRRGFCVWLTGLSASGKSTTARALASLLEKRRRPVTLLDGEIVRAQLSKDLGFSREDRLTNVRRIGFVASEIVRHGGAVVCAVISPYRVSRDEIRALIGPEGFVEVFVSTPLETCITRDPKGLYGKAMTGELKGFTGIDDPYEPPLSPELVLDTTGHSAQENAERILAYLAARHWL